MHELVVHLYVVMRLVLDTREHTRRPQREVIHAHHRGSEQDCLIIERLHGGNHTKIPPTDTDWLLRDVTAV